MKDISGKGSKGCHDCANNLNGTYCTMQKDMKLAKHKKCDGKIILPRKPKKTEFKPRKKRIVNVTKSDDFFENDFVHFLRKGGHWSAITGKINE